MIENPVRSPIVPPIAESLSINLADLSFLYKKYKVVGSRYRVGILFYFYLATLTYSPKSYRSLKIGSKLRESWP